MLGLRPQVSLLLEPLDHTEKSADQFFTFPPTLGAQCFIYDSATGDLALENNSTDEF